MPRLLGNEEMYMSGDGGGDDGDGDGVTLFFF